MQLQFGGISEGVETFMCERQRRCSGKEILQQGTLQLFLWRWQPLIECMAGIREIIRSQKGNTSIVANFKEKCLGMKSITRAREGFSLNTL